jgi:hypothetical protein
VIDDRELLALAGWAGEMGRVVEKYTIDLDTILQILGGFQQNGVLQGDLPVRKVGNKVPWRAYLRLVEGKVVACSIIDNRDRPVQSGESALNVLRRAGQLHWLMNREEGSDSGPLPTEVQRRITPALPQYSPVYADPPQGMSTSSLVPRRLILMSMEQMNQTGWSRIYRQVYAMVDGARSVETIASILRVPVGNVERVLNDLQMMRIIAFDYEEVR